MQTVGSEGQQQPLATERHRDWKELLVCAPMGFELQLFDADHPYVIERGFTSETIKHFGLGFTDKGILNGRLVIPLHNSVGEFVGYAGRVTRDDRISEKCPKYLFVGGRHGTPLGFCKSLLLYNAHNVRESSKLSHIIIVEAFDSVWWLWQHGFRKVVATMGRDFSTQQAALVCDLVSRNGEAWAFTDGDDAGKHCACQVFLHLGRTLPVRLVRLPNGARPSDCDGETLTKLLTIRA